MGQPRIGLVLSAGGARGLAHIAVLEALDRVGIRPAWIAGCSIGAIVGSAYAAGMPGRDIRSYTLSIFADRTKVFAKLWDARPRGLKNLIAPAGWNPTQLNSEKLMDIFLPEAVPERFEDLSIPFTVVASDFFAHRTVVLETGDLRSAVAASMSLPFLCRPVMRTVTGDGTGEARCLIDGGATNPMPIDVLHGRADRVIAVDVVGGPEPGAAMPPPAGDVVIGAVQIMLRAIASEKLKVVRPDILVKPPIASFGVLDFFKAKMILRAAESERDDLARRFEKLLKAAA